MRDIALVIRVDAGNGDEGEWEKKGKRSWLCWPTKRNWGPYLYLSIISYCVAWFTDAIDISCSIGESSFLFRCRNKKMMV